MHKNQLILRSKSPTNLYLVGAFNRQTPIFLKNFSILLLFSIKCNNFGEYNHIFARVHRAAYVSTCVFQA